jgi:hypothetical protein
MQAAGVGVFMPHIIVDDARLVAAVTGLSRLANYDWNGLRNVRVEGGFGMAGPWG